VSPLDVGAPIQWAFLLALFVAVLFWSFRPQPWLFGAVLALFILLVVGLWDRLI